VNSRLATPVVIVITCLIALPATAAGTVAGGDAVLVDQIPDGPHRVGTVPSYDRPGSAVDNSAADDFTVPKGRTYTIHGIHATGFAIDGGGTVAVNVTLFSDASGRPGRVLYFRQETPENGTCSDGNQCVLDAPLLEPRRLKPGNYWFSAQAVGDFVWRWAVTPDGSRPLGAAAVWENPEGGLGVGCRDWTRVVDCTWTNASNGTDLWYLLRGEVTDSRFSLRRFEGSGRKLSIAASFISTGMLDVKGKNIERDRLRVAAGRRRVPLALTDAARRDLDQGENVTVRLRAAFTATGGVPYKQTASTTLRAD